MRIRFVSIIFLISIIPVLTSCKKNHYKVDTSSITAKVVIKRLEKDLFTLDPNSITTKVPYLKQEYKGFLQLFSYVIKTGDINEASFGDYLVGFCTDKQNNEVYTTTMKVFPDVSKIENDLTEAFRHYLYYFPKKNIPAFFTCITGFNCSLIRIAGDSVMGIGLDRYLGADCKYYPMLEIYKYMSAKMTPENIVPDCMYGFAFAEWDFSTLKYPADNVLAEIIHNGKLKYFEKCMLPETTDELIFGFSAEQLKFSQNNESQMWQYIVENDMLFKTDQFTIAKLTGDAPFTSYFSKESPGRAAVWLGFRIVESYMMKNPSVKLGDLMTNTDVQSILEKSKYNPQ